MINSIYKITYSLLDAIVGKTLRLFQKMLISKKIEGNVTDLVLLNAKDESAQFAIKNFQKAMIFDTKNKLWDHLIELLNEKDLHVHTSKDKHHSNFKTEKIMAEFGVWKGDSINYFGKKLPNFQIYGFDSFEGLEENWYGSYLTKNSFNRNLKIPKVEKNIKISAGWFEDTIDEFCSEIEGKVISLLHMDADTYKPTKLVLNKLKSNLVPNTIILFDEYFGYPNWKLHEYKAFQEFCTKNNIKYNYIAYSNEQVAVRLK